MANTRRTEEITSISNLLSVAAQSADRFGCQPWYRGQSIAGKALVPEIMRRKYDEQGLANEFRDRARSRHPECPGANEYGPWMFLMQHYGLPTRLLDWTESPLVALYFAVETEKNWSSPADFFVLDALGLNQEEIHSAEALVGWEEDPAASLFAEAWKGEGCGPRATVAITTLEWDTRMMAQSTRFTLHGSRKPIDKLPGCERFLRRFVIPARFKRKLDHDLWTLGIRRALLFPHLEDLSGQLKASDYPPR